MHSFSPILPLRKSREQRQAERYARKQLFERMKIRGDNKGWQITSSAGMPTWQWIDGGRFQPVNNKFMQSALPRDGVLPALPSIPNEQSLV